MKPEVKQGSLHEIRGCFSQHKQEKSNFLLSYVKNWDRWADEQNFYPPVEVKVKTSFVSENALVYCILIRKLELRFANNQVQII